MLKWKLNGLVCGESFQILFDPKHNSKWGVKMYNDCIFDHVIFAMISLLAAPLTCWPYFKKKKNFFCFAELWFNKSWLRWWHKRRQLYFIKRKIKKKIKFHINDATQSGTNIISSNNHDFYCYFLYFLRRAAEEHFFKCMIWKIK